MDTLHLKKQLRFSHTPWVLQAIFHLVIPWFFFGWNQILIHTPKFERMGYLQTLIWRSEHLALWPCGAMVVHLVPEPSQFIVTSYVCYTVLDLKDAFFTLSLFFWLPGASLCAWMVGPRRRKSLSVDLDQAALGLQELLHPVQRGPAAGLGTFSMSNPQVTVLQNIDNILLPAPLLPSHLPIHQKMASAAPGLGLLSLSKKGTRWTPDFCVLSGIWCKSRQAFPGKVTNRSYPQNSHTFHTEASTGISGGSWIL